MMFRPWENIEHTKVNNENKFKETKSLVPVNLRAVYDYLKCQRYPGYVMTKNEKSNFRRQTRSFYVSNDILFYKKNAVPVIYDEEERKQIVKMLHEGSDESIESVALSSHRGRDATLNMLKKRFYWPSMSADVKSQIKNCDICQRVNPATLKIVPEMHSVPIPKMVFKQIGIDLITLPEVNGYRYVAVAIDYFSKWCEARPLPDKKAVTVARFIYDEIICRHGCPKVEISDQGKEFCNQLCEELFRMTGTTHKVTSPYHPQANGLVERFNRTIKNSLLKIHTDNTLKWPDVLQGVLFAYRTVPHTSTKFSPFYVLYQREAILPVDLKHKLEDNDTLNEEVYTGHFDEEKFEETLKCMFLMRDKLQEKIETNILDAQFSQKKSYAKRHPLADNTFRVGDKVLVKNLRRDDRKGGWVSMPWVGPFIINKIINNKICELRNDLKILKTKVLVSNIKKYYESDDKKSNSNSNKTTIEAPSKTVCQDKEISTSYNLKTDVNNDDDDIIISSKTELVKNRVFYPISKSWQQTKCRTLKLNLSEHNFTKSYIKPKVLSTPTNIRQIVGDGNCFYRALSFWISGEEENHFSIRQQICKIVETHAGIKKYIGGTESLNTYLKQKSIENDGVWATDVEIFGAAILLNTPIYVYVSDRNTWELFCKDITIKNPLSPRKKCLYIRNISNVHYDVVLDVE